uniref:Ras-GAP domain-containing protein n=1 Tax=Schistosoma mansoni TaxID=6183 RepID=A0A5K4EGR0_SCHMA
MDFFNVIPFRDRTSVSSTLTEIRNSLDDVIPNTNPIAPFISKVRQLQLVFMRIPMVLRKQIKFLLLEGLEASSEISNPLLCIFTLCLCLLELSVLRNCDRSDLESEDIWTTIKELNRSVFPKLCEKVKQQKTNLPSLLSWSYCMLAFTFYACAEWVHNQGCKPSPLFCVQNSIVIDETILDHPTVPNILRHILYNQVKNRPYFTPPTSRTLLDLIFSSAISSNAGILMSCKYKEAYNLSDCCIEFDEPPVQPVKVDEVKVSPRDKPRQLPSCFQDNLQTGSFKKILSNLSLLKQLLGNSDSHNSLLEPLIFSLRQSPFILKRLRSCLASSLKPNNANVCLYEKIYTLLLQLWFQAAMDRTLLKNFPQSYIWLCGFTCPMYEVCFRILTVI